MEKKIMPENPWIVQAPKQIEQVPIGSYTAKFQGVSTLQLPTGEDKWRWAWKINNGEHANKEASALTDIAINLNTHAGRLISGLLGRQLVAGEDVEQVIEGCKGKTYIVSVQPGPKGGKPAVRMVAALPTM
jgi:hypothetical protein